MSKRPTIGEQEWGRTPWESMTPEEHLRETQRLYAALVELRGVALRARLGNEASPVWGPDGMEARSLAMAEEALAPYIKRDRVRESIYRSFFRVAVSLLFRSRREWFIHRPCGAMVAASLDGKAPDRCYDCAAQGKSSTPMRPITWADLRPLSAGKKESKAR